MKKRSGAPKSAKNARTKAKLDFETRAKSAGVFVQKATRTKSVTKRQRSIRNRRTASGADRHLECSLERLLHCKKEISAVQWPRNPSQRKKKMDLFLVLCKEDEHKNRGLTLLQVISNGTGRAHACEAGLIRESDAHLDGLPVVGVHPLPSDEPLRPE